MKITNARVIVTSPGRSYATLKIETDEGLYGLGDASLAGREMAVVSYLEHHVLPMLIGRDPAAIEDIWQLLYRGAYWRRGPVTMTAIAAVDMALWDIKGKALNTPVWNLLGGRVRRGILAYTHVSARDGQHAADLVRRKQEGGYRAVRVQVAVPGVREMYGVPMPHLTPEAGYFGSVAYEETDWAPEKYLRFIPQVFDELRREIGFDVALLHDSHHRLTPSQAGWLGKRLEDFQLLWLEDVVPAEMQSSYRQIRAATTTPLAVGEVFNSLYDAELLIREQLIDYLRATIVHAGGVTGLRKIAAFAEPYLVKTGCHGAFDLSPVTMAASLHFGCSTHNAAVQEYMRFPDQAGEVFSWDWAFEDGYLSASDAPGLGVDIDEAAASRFPYERTYLPLSRLHDGSIGNW
jgi:mannonate dehydratase